jgi:hypothetical protein
MKFSEGQIDPVRLEEGAWVENIPEMGGLRFKVRGAGNADWRKLERTLLEAVPRKRRVGGRLTIEDQDRITSTCLQNCGLLDWDGFEDDDNKPVPYSKEIAHEICFLPQNRRYRDAVLYACNVVAEEKDADKDDIVKN